MKLYNFGSSQSLRSIRNDFQARFKNRLFSLLLALTVAGVCQSARASAGGLDPTFGNGGKVLTDFGNGNDSNEFASALALQPDGKIVAAGYRFFGNSSGGADMLIVRYNTDGTLDSTFGSG